ncbi:MAG: HD domain-containing protein [Desulfobulbaceae bacterium]|nr:HD domain-containing protein [Desulfobulbaceae bacterium]
MAERLIYNSRITNTYLKLVRKRYPQVDLADLLAYAGMEPQQVADEGHWFSQEQVNLFQERLVVLTGNPEIAREAGLFTASPEVLGGIRSYLLGLVSPARAYDLVGRFTSKFTRSAKYESRPLGSCQVEVLVTPYPGVREEPFQCKNRRGYLEAISRLFGYRLPHIAHPECLFRGDPVCRYIVSWEESRFSRWMKWRRLAAAVLIPAFVASFFVFSPHFAVAWCLPLTGATLLLLSWYLAVLKNRELQAAVDSLQTSADELIQQININYENSLLINEIGQALNRQLELDGLLQHIVAALEKRLDYDRGLIMLASPDKSRLLFKAGYGYNEEQQALLEKANFHLDNPHSQGVFVVSFREQHPFLLNDFNEIKGQLSPRSYEFAKNMGAKSFICCPIVFENESLGILAVDNLSSTRPLLERHKNLLMGVANQIAISIHNAHLMEARLRQFQSILKVLVASTDARDPITAGHSLRVTEYALGISKELELAPAYCDVIRVASLLHDYGKIGVEDKILKKPGRLDPEEYEAIKTHVVKTRQILEEIEFEGVYRTVPEIAGAHHERVDGTGYPRGVKGNDIPLGAKIIAVADVFEALTSRRHYREPMPVEEAFALLDQKIGSRFDRDCVEALGRYYWKQQEQEAAAA